jgi:hypothetical protein
MQHCRESLAVHPTQPLSWPSTARMSTPAPFMQDRLLPRARIDTHRQRGNQPSNSPFGRQVRRLLGRRKTTPPAGLSTRGVAPRPIRADTARLGDTEGSIAFRRSNRWHCFPACLVFTRANPLIACPAAWAGHARHSVRNALAVQVGQQRVPPDHSLLVHGQPQDPADPGRSLVEPVETDRQPVPRTTRFTERRADARLNGPIVTES